MFLVTKQDVCRFYKEDFWGELIRRKNVKNHLNRVVFGKPKRSRIAQMNYRPTRFEVIRMDNRRFKRKRRIPKMVIRYHNVEKVRLYYSNMDEYGLRAYIMLQRRKKRLSGSSYVDNVCIYDRLGYRLDHVILTLNWARTIMEARRKIINGFFQVNNYIPLKYDFLPVFGDELRVRNIFKKHITRELKRLRFERFLNYAKLQQRRINYMKRKKLFFRRKKVRYLRRAKKISKNIILKVKRFRRIRLYHLRQRIKNRISSSDRYQRMRVPHSFFPRSFLPPKYSIVQNRFLKLRGVKGDFSNIGINMLFGDEFLKPEMDWHFKLGKFFFDRFLYHYNGRFCFYRNFCYYENEGLKNLNNLMTRVVSKTILAQLSSKLYNFYNDIESFFPLINSNVDKLISDRFAQPLLLMTNDFFGNNSNSKIEKTDLEIKNAGISNYFLHQFGFVKYFPLISKQQYQFFRILVDHFNDFKGNIPLVDSIYKAEEFDKELNIDFSPVFSVFQRFRDLTQIMEKRSVFSILWLQLYLSRLRRSNFISEVVSRLARSNKSMFAHLSKRFKFQFNMLKFGALTKNFSRSIQSKVSETSIQAGSSRNSKNFYPDLELNEYAVPLSRIKFVADFSIPISLGQDRTFLETNAWLNSFLLDLSFNAILTHKKLLLEKIAYKKNEPHKLMITHFGEYFTKNSNFVESFFRSSRFINKIINKFIGGQNISNILWEKFAKMGYNKRDSKFIELLKLKLQEEEEAALKSSNDPSKLLMSFNQKLNKNSEINPLIKKAAEPITKELLNNNIFANKFVGILKNISSKFNFYNKVIPFRKKLRPLNSLFLPYFRRKRNKRRRTLLMRSFSNLVINYGLLKVLFIGYRKIRRTSLPFFYYPCKFSVKAFLNHFGCKQRMKFINKKKSTYLIKPRLPFKLPNLNKKKFGMMDRARTNEIPVDKKRNHVKRALTFILNH